MKLENAHLFHNNYYSHVYVTLIETERARPSALSDRTKTETADHENVDLDLKCNHQSVKRTKRD